MATKKFTVTFSVTAVIELDEQVLAVVDDEWRGQFYPLLDNSDIAEHIAYNMVSNGACLSQLDGWGDQPDSNAILRTSEWELDEVVEN